MKHQRTVWTQVDDGNDADGRQLGRDRLTVRSGSERVTPLKLLRFPAIRERTGLSRSTIWRLERRGVFPRHRRISANTVAWIEEEIDIWIRERAGE